MGAVVQTPQVGPARRMEATDLGTGRGHLIGERLVHLGAADPVQQLGRSFFVEHGHRVSAVSCMHCALVRQVVGFSTCKSARRSGDDALTHKWELAHECCQYARR